jgi:ssDNA-binding Zn-finger/Zn-ribbon topoisomerase 1
MATRQARPTIDEAAKAIDAGIREIRTRVGALPSDTPHCPDCGARMVMRRARKTHNAFWGCSQYPRCSGYRRWKDGERYQL